MGEVNFREYRGVRKDVCAKIGVFAGAHSCGLLVAFLSFFPGAHTNSKIVEVFAQHGHASFAVFPSFLLFPAKLKTLRQFFPKLLSLCCVANVHILQDASGHLM